MNRKATRSRNSGGLESYSRSAFQKQTLQKSIFGLELSKSASKRCMTPFALKVFHEMHGTYKVRPGTCRSYLRSFEAVPQCSHRDGRQSQAWVAHEETSHFRRKSILIAGLHVVLRFGGLGPAFVESETLSVGSVCRLLTAAAWGMKQMDFCSTPPSSESRNADGL